MMENGNMILRKIVRAVAALCVLCVCLAGCGKTDSKKKEPAAGSSSETESTESTESTGSVDSLATTSDNWHGVFDESGKGSNTQTAKPQGTAPSGGSGSGSSSGGGTSSAGSSSAPSTESASVSFQNDGQLFAPDKSGDFFNYCPSVLQVDSSTRYVYYCTNGRSRNVTDNIACRKGTLTGGKWSYGEETIVLSPGGGKDNWDERHVCDPSVIAGNFRYDGGTYQYMMAFLGCHEYTPPTSVSEYYDQNQVGIAVANDPAGPWTKCDSINPIAKFDWKKGDKEQWGKGQPSIVSADKAGKVLLFYTTDVGGWHTEVQRWDFSVENPKPEFTVKVPTAGLYDLNGAASSLVNADFGFDEATNRFYAVSDVGPHPSDADPDFISGSFRVVWLEDTPVSTEGHVVGDVFRDAPNSKWQTVATVGKGTTGKDRNHNPGLVTDKYGHMPAGKDIEVFYSVSDTVENAAVDWDYLKTYRIHGCVIKNARK